MKNLFNTSIKILSTTTLLSVILTSVAYIWFSFIIGLGTRYWESYSLLGAMIVFGICLVLGILIMINLATTFYATISIRRELLIKFYGKKEFFIIQQINYLIGSVLSSFITILISLILSTNNEVVYSAQALEGAKFFSSYRFDIAAFVFIILIFVYLALLNFIAYIKDIYLNNKGKYFTKRNRILTIVFLIIRSAIIFITSLVILNVNEFMHDYKIYNFNLTYTSESALVLGLIFIMLSIIFLIEYYDFYKKEVTI